MFTLIFLLVILVLGLLLAAGYGIICLITWVLYEILKILKENERI